MEQIFLSREFIFEMNSRDVEALEKGINDTFDLLYNNIKDRPDNICGWLLFYSDYLQASLNMDLVHRTRLDYHFSLN